MNKLIDPNSIDPLMKIRCLSQDSVEYPRRLLDLCDPPKKLFYIGNVGLLNQPMVAIVGARKASQTGLLHAHHFAAGLGRRADITSSRVLPVVSIALLTAACWL